MALMHSRRLALEANFPKFDSTIVMVMMNGLEVTQLWKVPTTPSCQILLDNLNRNHPAIQVRNIEFTNNINKWDGAVFKHASNTV